MRAWLSEVIASKPGTRRISGMVTDAEGTPVEGARVQSGATHWTFTDATGSYDLAGLIDGARTLTVSHPSLVWSPGSISVTLNGADLTGQDFTGGAVNAPPVASNVAITGTAAVGETLLGGYDYSDAEGDAESGTTFQWYRSNDGTFDGGDTPVGAASSYLVQAGDAGKTLFFEVTPGAATGTATGNAVASTGTLVSVPPPPPGGLLVEENFGGTGTALNGTAADTFAAGITAAGGSATWAAGSAFLDDGTVTVGSAQTGAYLNLGSYINDAKGTAAGQFDLTMTISETVGEWISLGFTTQNTPSTAKNFTNTGTGGTTTGIATIIRREIGDWDLDAIAGPGNTNQVPGPEETGARTLTVSLDFTPTGGWDGASNFGTVTFSDSVYGTIGSHTYTADNSFGAIFISEAGVSGGTISALSLSQIPEPSALALLGLGGLFLARRRR
jgi:hypothetical protein